MVALHWWNNFYSMVIVWKRDPEYLGRPLLRPIQAIEREPRQFTTIPALIPNLERSPHFETKTVDVGYCRG